MENKDNLNDYQCKAVGLSGHEKRRAGEKFREYQKIYHIESFSDLQILEELVYRETLQEIYKKTLLEKKDKEKKELSSRRIQNNLNDNLEQILILKEKLGLFKDKKQSEDAFQYIQTLKKKFKIWREENQGSRTCICPHCGQMILLKIKIDEYDAAKHPFFRDRILTNDHLLKIYKEGKITKEDVAKVLGVSSDYVDWIIDKYYSN